jgi:hypothetical protein
LKRPLTEQLTRLEIAVFRGFDDVQWLSSATVTQEPQSEFASHGEAEDGRLWLRRDASYHAFRNA